MENLHTIPFSKTLTAILNSMNQLDSKELDVLFFRIKKQKYKNYPTVLSKPESELLENINSGLPAGLQKRYENLRLKRINETLTENEYAEFLKLIEKIEKFDVERMRNLIELAKLRNITLNELSEQLGLKPQMYVA